MQIKLSGTGRNSPQISASYVFWASNFSIAEPILTDVIK